MNRGEPITKADLYGLGLSGRAGSTEKRRELLVKLRLPERLSPNSLLEVLNALMAVVKYTKTVSYLEDDEIAVVRPDGIKFYTPFLDEIQKKKATIDWDISAADKGGYEHYMFKEIMEQPQAVERTIAPYITEDRIDLSSVLDRDYVKALSRIIIIACGSSSHARSVGAILSLDMAERSSPLYFPVRTQIARGSLPS